MDIADSASLFNVFWSLILILVVGCVLYLWQPFGPRLDPREPPLVEPKIPYIGHLIGILLHQAGYVTTVSSKTNLPIFTMPIMGGKLYTITTPAYFQSAMRAKNLVFEPVVAEGGVKMHGLSPEAAKIWTNLPKDPKEPTFLREAHKINIEQMHPGPTLQRMNAVVLTRLADHFNEIENLRKDSMYLWLRDIFTIAVSTSLFGAHNPLLLNPALIQSFWDFEDKSILMIANVLPSIVAPKAYKGRAAIWAALTEYVAAGYDIGSDVSSVVRADGETGRKFGFPLKDIAHFHNGMLFGATSNATPTIFWLNLHVFADPKLLAAIRSEVAKVCTIVDKGDNHKREVTIDVTTIATSCPVLQSAYQEVLRLKSYGVLNRLIEEDTVLSDSDSSYLVKKGCMLQVPMNVIHCAPDVWGQNAHSYDAARFLPSEDTKEQEKMRKKAFIAFGGGSNLCPGRHFAFSEILGLTALLAMGFEITNQNGGLLQVPENPNRRIWFAESVIKPSKELWRMGVTVSRRRGWEDVVWKFKV